MKMKFERYFDGTLYATVEQTITDVLELAALLEQLGFYQNFDDCLTDFNSGEATYRVDVDLASRTTIN